MTPSRMPATSRPLIDSWSARIPTAAGWRPTEPRVALDAVQGGFGGGKCWEKWEKWWETWENMGRIWENMGEWGKDAGNNVVEDEEHDEDMVEEKTIMVERGWENLCGDIWLGMGGSFFLEEKRILTMGEIPIRRPFLRSHALSKLELWTSIMEGFTTGPSCGK